MFCYNIIASTDLPPKLINLRENDLKSRSIAYETKTSIDNPSRLILILEIIAGETDIDFPNPNIYSFFSQIDNILIVYLKKFQ